MKSIYLLLIFCLLFACNSKEEPVLIDEGEQETENSVPGEEVTSFEPCINGMAGIYPCKGYDLLANIPVGNFNAQEANDIWGWTDVETGKEYALMGVDNGTVFVDITDASNLVYLGKLPTATVSSSWRDIKVYGNYAYIVSEARDHGVQIFNLLKLRDTTNAPYIFAEDGRYTGIGNAHNIVINEDTGYAYPVGTALGDQYNGGVHFLNLENPITPSLSGGWGENGYTHDAQVITYNGPDMDFLGSEIFVGANEDRIVVVDVSNKEAPIEIATLSYSNVEYTHQGWFTDDHRFFIVGDEVDEVRFGFNTRTLIFDMADLNNPVLHDTYQGPTNAIDHNGYVLGEEFFLSNYTAGLRVLDISGIADRDISEKAFFDTYPANDNTQFSGVWSVYPYFESGKIIISDINNGLFVVQKSK